MPASLNLPRFQPANDRPRNQRHKTAARVSLFAPQSRSLLPLLAGGALLFGLTAAATIAIEWNRQDAAPAAALAPLPDHFPAAPLAPQTRVTVAAPAPTTALTDMVLPAAALTAPAEAPPEEEVNAVAKKIADMPALNDKPHKASITVGDAPPDSAAALLTQARSSLMAGDTAAAEELYHRVLASDTHNHDALYGTVVALAQQGQDDEAISAAEHLLKLYPHDAAAEDNLAQILARTGRGGEALTHMDHAAREAPDNLSLRLDLASLYDRFGKVAEALMLYRQVLAASEDNEASGLPLASIRQRAAYLAALSADATELPSTTASDDGR